MTVPERARVFESEPIKRAVLRQVIPAVASQLIALIYSLADTWFTGLLGDPRQTAAITVVYPSFVMLTAVSNLAGVGGAAALARALGAKKPRDAERIASVSIWTGAALAALFVTVFTLLRRPVLSLCGAFEGIMPFAEGYAAYAVTAGGVFTVLSNVLASLIRAEGCAGNKQKAQSLAAEELLRQLGEEGES